MQILLKQREIEAALKLYVASQGINVTNKTFEINFTASRGTAGLTAEIDITEVDIPGYSDPEPQALYVVTRTEPAPEVQEVDTSSPEVEEECTDPVKAKVEMKTGASLFS